MGALGELKAVWDIADTLNRLMAFPNLIALIIMLSGVVVRLLKGFFSNEPYSV